MRVSRLELADFRNISAASFTPGQALTVICGKNGQGKTNLLEAVWLLTGGKSFRGAKDADLIRRGAETALIQADTEGGGITREIQLRVGLPGSARPGRSFLPRMVQTSPFTLTSPAWTICLASPPVSAREAYFSRASSLINSV